MPKTPPHWVSLGVLEPAVRPLHTLPGVFQESPDAVGVPGRRRALKLPILTPSPLIPFSLIRWEVTGRDEEIEDMAGAWKSAVVDTAAREKSRQTVAWILLSSYPDCTPRHPKNGPP